MLNTKHFDSFLSSVSAFIEFLQSNLDGTLCDLYDETTEFFLVDGDKYFFLLLAATKSSSVLWNKKYLY